MKRFIKTPLGISITAIIVIGLGIILLSSAGYHIQGLKIISGGDVIIEGYEDSLQVILDSNEISGSVTKSGIVENIVPGEHEIIVFKNGFWPWVKNITVQSSESVVVSPFLAAKNASGLIIPDNDPEYNSIRTSINQNQIPTENNPITSEDASVSVWVSENTIVAKWLREETDAPQYLCDEKVCTEPTVIFESTNSFRNVEFYKNRNDTLLLSTQNGIFILEMDDESQPRNFQPIYKGTAQPRFELYNENEIYVLDGGLVFIVAI